MSGTKHQRLLELLKKDSRVILGMMSGMSMDGMDFALARISGAFPQLNVELLAGGELAFEPALRTRLLASRQNATARDVCELNMEVAQAFSTAALSFLAHHGFSAADVDAIGSHGQTLVHLPPGSDALPSTLQLGAPSAIAELTGIATVGNFRVRDMAAGGHGAPLIPLLDFILYREPGRVRALNNLGSISNVTVVTERFEDVFAFDTGPANMALDHFARKISGDDEAIDRDGHLSSLGEVHTRLLDALLSLPYFSLPPPKSAGFEDFGPPVLDRVVAEFPDCGEADLMRTMIEFTVESLARAYERYILPRHPSLDSIVLTGGGARHPLVVSRLRERVPKIDVVTLHSENAALNAAKEALGMAVLANEFLSGRPGNLCAVPGARLPVILGELAP